MEKTPEHITNSFLRTRMLAIRKAIFSLRLKGHNNRDREIRMFSAGVIPEGFDMKTFNKYMKELDLGDNDPLQMDEIASFNNWFLLHPEKVAGREKQITSFHFPVTIIGDRQSITQTIKRGITKQNFDFDLSLKRRRAKAKLLLADGLSGLKIIKQGLTLKTTTL